MSASSPVVGAIKTGLSALWPRSSPWPRATAIAWIVLGVINSVAAIRAAITHQLLGDHWSVVAWLNGTEFNVIHSNPAATISYPPHAWLLLAPLGWIPDDAGVIAVPLVYLLFRAAAVWLMADWTAMVCRVRLTHWHRAAYIGLVLSSGSTFSAVTWGQNTVVALVGLVAALLTARKRPIVAGLLFALASYKLNIVAAGAIILALSGTWLTLGVAFVITLGLTGAVSVLVGQSPIDLVVGYVRLLITTYGSRPALSDIMGIRRLLDLWVADTSLVSALWATFAGVSIAGAWVLIHRSRGQGCLHPAAVALVWLLGLVLLPQGFYNVQLLFPMAWLLQWPEADLGVSRPVARVIGLAAIVVLVGRIPAALESWVLVRPPLLTIEDVPMTMTWWEEQARLIVFVLIAIAVRRLWQLAQQKTSEPRLKGTASAP